MHKKDNNYIGNMPYSKMLDSISKNQTNNIIKTLNKVTGLNNNFDTIGITKNNDFISYFIEDNKIKYRDTSAGPARRGTRCSS